MNFFTKMSGWIKNHTLLTIFIGVIVIGAITTAIILLNSNTANLNPDNSSTSSDNDNSGSSSNIKPNNILQDGTYNCELMYDGKSLDNDEVIKSWLQKLATYESSIDVDKINISDFRKGLFDEFGLAHIVKEENIVKLNFSNGSETVEFISYDINNNQFNLNKEWSNTEDENAWNTVETIFNKLMSVKQNKNSFTYENFGFILIYPSIVNNNINNGTSIDNIDIDYDKYTGLGDLFCGSNVSLD